MIIMYSRLNRAEEQHPDFIKAVLEKGKPQGDFLNIPEGDYYDIAKANTVDFAEAKAIATGQSKLAIAAKMAAGFTTTMMQTAVAKVQGQPALCNPEQRQNRIDICAGNEAKGIPRCQFYIPSEQRCSECGCPKQPKLFALVGVELGKVDFVQATCPKHKWPIL